MTHEQMESILTEAFRAVFGACPVRDFDFEAKNDHA